VFEFFVALRYLGARRRDAALSLITIVSVLGVAAGVAALVIALAINNGFRNTLQRSLLGATAHINILEKEPGEGIRNYRELQQTARQLPGVQSATSVLYGPVFLSARTSSGATLKGLDLQDAGTRSGLQRMLQSGDLSRENGVWLGSRLAAAAGLRTGSTVQLIIPLGELTPFGFRPSWFQAQVNGIVETGFYEVDSQFIFTSLPQARRFFGIGDVVSAVELRLDDIYAAPTTAAAMQTKLPPSLGAQSWMEQNRQILNALQLEKMVTLITIGLIQIVAALNLFIMLVMVVNEKSRDIAILASMGARPAQVARIFRLQGLLLGVAGSVVGLFVGHVLCYLAHRYRWVSLAEELYALSWVPFEPWWMDSVWIVALALGVSGLATLYPARRASQVAPAEALRYE
jgi:lipoprotein-releasing system permease protein